MTEVAPLQIQVNSESVNSAKMSLDQLMATCQRVEPAVQKVGDAGKTAAAGLATIPAGLQAIDARTDALRASVDPLAMAMKRANAELAEAAGLYRAGALSAAEYDRYVGILEGRIEAATAAQAGLNAMQARGAASARLTAQESLNLSRQFADVGVSLAAGMPFWLVAIQQGSQIGDTFQIAGERGVGLTAIVKQLGGQVAGLAQRFWPVLLVTAALGGALALSARAINDNAESADQLQRRLGLTSDQMKRLQKDGVDLNVTLGDTFRGVMKVAGEEFSRLGGFIWDMIGGPLKAFGAFVGDLWTSAVDGAVWFIRSMVGGFGALVGGLKAVLPSLPAAVSEAAVSAVNVAIRAIVDLLNKTTGFVNGFIERANSAARAVGLKIKLPTFSAVDFAGINTRFEGAGEEAMRSFGGGARKGMDEALGALDGLVAYGADIGRRIGEAARGFRDERATAGAGDARGSRADGAGGDAEATDDFARALADFNERMKERNGLAAEYARIVNAMPTDKELAKAEYAQKIREQAAAFAEAAGIMADADARAQDAAQGMAASFGKVGKALGDVLTAMTRYGARQAELAERRKAEGVTAVEIARIDRESARARVAYYGDMLGAAKGFFKEGSDGYKALQAVEAGYRAWQFAASIQAAIQAQAEAASKIGADNASTTSHLANAAKTMATDAATTSTGIAAGASRIFAALGPYGFPVVAAMLGVMASLGAGGGGGGASGVSISERRQREQGTGSVLGDAAAKSVSIANALEIVASNTNRDLEYSNAMLRALRSIDSQIGAVAAALARQLGASGILDTSSLNLGTVQKGGSLLSGFGFGSTTTKTLKDQGLEFTAGTLADILSKGLSGQAYQTVRTSSSSSFLGMTYSSSSSTKTKKTALDAALAEEFTRLIGSLRDGVLSAANVLGVEGADAVLAAFKVNIGRISLKDLSGEEIEKTLQAVFSKVGDDMAAAVLPGLKAVQNVGEGLFETLMRVARQYQVIDVTLSTIGKTFGMVGVSSIGARERLIDLFGSLDDFTDQVGFYAENFLTEAERLAPIQTAVTAELARLGLAGVKTRDQFKTVVQGLDVSTAAGAELFAALMSLAPAFAKVTEETQSVTDAREALSRAYERESEAILDTKDRFAQLAADLGKFRSSLYSGPAAAMSPEAAYLAAQAEFARVRGLALGGNEEALGELQSVSQAYLDASKAYFASSTGYFADLEAVRAAVTAAEGIAGAQATLAEQQLDQLKALVSGYIEVNESVLSVRDAITALQVAQGGPLAPPAASAFANDNSAVTARLEAMEKRLAEVVQELAEANGQLAAANEQRAAVYAAEKANLEEQTSTLERRLRDLA